MEEKDNYTKQEIEEMLFVVKNYTNQFNVYLEAITGKDANLQNAGINILNMVIEECNEKIPKSLIDKLGIKKIE